MNVETKTVKKRPELSVEKKTKLIDSISDAMNGNHAIFLYIIKTDDPAQTNFQTSAQSYGLTFEELVLFRDQLSKKLIQFALHDHKG